MVPCGHCTACRVARYSEWSTRLFDELDFFKNSVFLTLTYKDECLPDGGSLCKLDLQKFFRSLRKAITPFVVPSSVLQPSLRYYGVGEYGETYGRPHYHAIVYSNIDISPFVSECWSKGYYKIMPVNITTIDYVTRYVQKKLSGPMAEVEYAGKLPPFQIQSRGLGLRAAERDKELIVSNGKTRFGQHVAVPKYYVRKLGIEEVMRERAVRNRLDDLGDKARVLDEDVIPRKAFERAKNAESDQRGKTLTARLSMRKKRDFGGLM